MQGNPNHWRCRLAFHAAFRAWMLAAALLVALAIVASIFDGVLP